MSRYTFLKLEERLNSILYGKGTLRIRGAESSDFSLKREAIVNSHDTNLFSQRQRRVTDKFFRTIVTKPTLSTINKASYKPIIHSSVVYIAGPDF
jgi:hypothetical protein